MANPTVTILLETVDKTAGGFNSILSKLGMSDEKIEQINNKLPGLAAKFTLVSAAIGAVVKFTKEAVEETIKYGDAMNDLALSTGQPAEDMSRLAGAAERFGVDYKTLMSGLGTATKNGVDTSIDSLLNLADQYNAIKDPIEQAKWMTERFGAAGPEMAKIFRRGSDDILAAMGDVKDALVWDSNKQAAIEEYTEQLETLKQTWQSLVITIGTEVIPVVTEFLQILNGEGKTTLGSTTEETQYLAEKYSGLAGTAGGANVVLGETAVRLGNVGTAALGASSNIEGVGATAEEQSTAIWHFADGAWSLVGGLNSIPAKVDSFVTIHYSFEGIDSRDAVEWMGGQTWSPPSTWKPDWQNPNAGRPPKGPSPKYGDAWGGWESANTPYLVGERGPEIFVPGTSGKVIPNHQLGGGGGSDFDYDRFARIIAEEFQKVSR